MHNQFNTKHIYSHISNISNIKNYNIPSIDKVHASLAPLISTLSSQRQEIQELEDLVENFEDSWNEKFEISLAQDDLLSSQEYLNFKEDQGDEDARQELENVLFSRRLLWTRWKVVRDGIKSEREGYGVIGNDYLAWCAYRKLAMDDFKIDSQDGDDMHLDKFQGNFKNSNGGVNSFDDFDHLAAPDCPTYNYDFGDDYGDYDDVEVVEELEGQSVCMVHGICDHVTSQCLEAIGMLERDQYYFSRCDPRVNQNLEKNEKCKIPRYVPDDDDGRKKIQRSDLITYEENRTIYNYL